MWHDHPSIPGVKVRYHWDDGELVRETWQDAEPGMEAVKAARETNGWNGAKTMRKAASVPATLYYDWIVDWQRKGLLPDMHHPEFQRRANDLTLKKVRDSDYRAFKV
jgi:hypothetical protein